MISRIENYSVPEKGRHGHNEPTASGEEERFKIRILRDRLDEFGIRLRRLPLAVWGIDESACLLTVGHSHSLGVPLNHSLGA